MNKILKKVISSLLVVVMVMGVPVISPTKNTVKADSKAYTIKVNLGTNCTTIYKGNKPIKAMICSPSSETPTGTFYVPVKYRWHEMIGNCYAQYCTRIAPEILFHSVWYYKNGDKSTMSVSAYNVMGQKASHGCVRLLCKDAKWIYDHCAVGTKIKIFWGKKKDDPLKRPGFTPITNGKFTDWDPTDPDPKNPYRKKAPTVKAKSKTVEYGSKVKALSLVTIKDSAGNTVTNKNGKIKVSGKVNTKKLGTYKVKYIVKDSLGNKKTQTIKFKVVDTKKPKITGAAVKKNVPMGSSLNVLSGIKAVTASGANITSKIKVYVKHNGKKVVAKNGVVQFSEAGRYTITYKVTGKNKKKISKTVKYYVTNQKVKFALKSGTVTINQNDKFDYNSYVKSLTTYDGKALNIAHNVKHKGSVNTSKPGTYKITYTAQNGNQAYTAVSLTLTVVVKAKVPETTIPGTPETTAPENPTTAATPSGENGNETSGWTENY